MSGNDLPVFKKELNVESIEAIANNTSYDIPAYAREHILACVREIRKIRLASKWIACADYLPETGARRSAMSGWSKWLLCTNNEETIDDGAYCFTAAYSSELGCWHKLGNDKCKVTHWMPLLERPA
jgi:hypothetical protein